MPREISNIDTSTNTRGMPTSVNSSTVLPRRDFHSCRMLVHLDPHLRGAVDRQPSGEAGYGKQRHTLIGYGYTARSGPVGWRAATAGVAARDHLHRKRRTGGH